MRYTPASDVMSLMYGSERKATCYRKPEEALEGGSWGGEVYLHTACKEHLQVFIE